MRENASRICQRSLISLYLFPVLSKIGYPCPSLCLTKGPSREKYDISDILLLKNPLFCTRSAASNQIVKMYRNPRARMLAAQSSVHTSATKMGPSLDWGTIVREQWFNDIGTNYGILETIFSKTPERGESTKETALPQLNLSQILIQKSSLYCTRVKFSIVITASTVSLWHKNSRLLQVSQPGLS